MVSWDDVRRRLETELSTLRDREFVIVGEPAGRPGPPRGLLRRRPPPTATRYAQIRRDGEHLWAECVGATSFGGDWEVDTGTHERLRGLGWLVPGDPDPSGVQPSYPNYWRVLPRADATSAAQMCADALAVLDADAEDLEWRRDA